jgi:hypothetical protein
MKNQIIKLAIHALVLLLLVNCGGKKNDKKDASTTATSPVSNIGDGESLQPTPSNPVAEPISPVLVSEPIGNKVPPTSSVTITNPINTSPTEVVVIDTNGSVQIVSDIQPTDTISSGSTSENAVVTTTTTLPTNVTVIIPDSIIEAVEDINSITDIEQDDYNFDHSQYSDNSEIVNEDNITQNGDIDTVKGNCMKMRYVGIVWFNHSEKSKAIGKKVLRCVNDQFQTTIHNNTNNESKGGIFYRVLFFNQGK